MQKFLVLALTSLVAGCAPITYVEPSGPGMQYDSSCGQKIFDKMTISLTEFNTDVYVSTYSDGATTWVEFVFQSLDDLDLQILSSQVSVRSELAGRKPSSAYLSHVGRKGEWPHSPGKRQSMVDDQPIEGATVRAFGNLNVHLTFEVASSDLPAMLDFPSVKLGKRIVSVAPIRLERKNTLRLGLCISK